MKKYILSLILVMFSSTVFGSISTSQVKNISKDFHKVKEDIYHASKTTGFDMEDLTAIASLESTFRVKVMNSYSKAKGLLQYTDRTWKQDRSRYYKELGLPKNVSVYNPKANLLIGAKSLQATKKYLIKKSPLSEKDIKLGDLYMSHFLGENGALKVLKAKPNTKMDKLVSISKGNYRYFYKNGKLRTAKEFREYMHFLVVREKKIYSKEVMSLKVSKTIESFKGTASLIEETVVNLSKPFNNIS